MTEPLPETIEGTISLLALADRERLLKGKSVVVIGPGISRNEETAEFVRDLVSVCPVSMVIDADGLNAFEEHAEDIKADAVVDPFACAFSLLTQEKCRGLPASRLERFRRVASPLLEKSPLILKPASC